MTLLDRLVAEGKNRLYLAGEWRDASDGRTIDVLDPATEDQIATVASGSPDDMLDAVAAADEAGPAWAATSPRHKAQVLRRAFDLMLEREKEFAELITVENGKIVAYRVNMKVTFILAE